MFSDSDALSDEVEIHETERGGGDDGAKAEDSRDS